MERLDRLVGFVRDRGVVWTSLYSTRWLLGAARERLDRALLRIERERHIVGPSTVSSASHTRGENRGIWQSWDWTRSGEEWTDDAARFGLDPAAWKSRLVDSMLRKWMPAGGVVLEIGPGGGRWTEHLLPLAGTLHLADISPVCLAHCRARFAAADNLRLHEIVDGTLAFLPDASIDAVWAYDVFVHINPSDTAVYLRELARVVRPGGVAVIHHAGAYADAALAESGFRSHMTGPLFARLAAEAGLTLVEQDTTLPHFAGDVISIVRRPERDARTV